MIVKSSQRSNAKQLAEHLSSSENEEVVSLGSYGLVECNSISGGLAEMEAIAKASRCVKHLYHVSISPSPQYKVTEKQWKRIWELHDEIQGLEGYVYKCVGHIKNNRCHQHRVYERVNPETGKAVNLSWTRLKNERIARQLEVELGHNIIQGKHNKSVIRALKFDGLHEIADKIAFTAKAAPAIAKLTHAECQQNKREKTLDESRNDISDAWAESNNAEGFETALKERGYALAHGDKVPVAVNAFGNEYPLLRSINVARKKERKTSIKKAELEIMIPTNTLYVEAVREKAIEYEWAYQESKVKNTSTLEALDEYLDQFSTQLIPKNTKKVTTKEPSKIKVSTPIEISNNLNSIQPSSSVQEQWTLYQEELFLEQYQGLDIDVIENHWKLSKLDDGSIMFSNELGNIIDHGRSITTDIKNHSVTSALMVTLAVSKGWDNLNVNGSDDFKLSVYKVAIERDITCNINTEEDKHIWLQVERDIQKSRNSLKLN